MPKLRRQLIQKHQPRYLDPGFQLEALLAGSHLSLKDKTDDIEVYQMSLEDVSLVYNVQTTNITKVVFFKRPKEKSNKRANISLETAFLHSMRTMQYP